MYYFVVSLHVVLCLSMILIILLQPGKGGDVGAAFGGGGAGAMFGPRGPAGILQRATTVVAVLFMVTSVSLSVYSNRSQREGADIGGEIERLQQEEAKQKKEVETPSVDEPAEELEGE